MKLRQLHEYDFLLNGLPERIMAMMASVATRNRSISWPTAPSRLYLTCVSKTQILWQATVDELKKAGFLYAWKTR